MITLRKIKYEKSKRGQTMLSLIFLVGGVIITIGITLSILAISFLTSIAGYRSSAIAEAAAISGANDGILQVVRNSGFSTASLSGSNGSPSGSYGLPFSSVSDFVTITQGIPLANEATIISLAQIGSTERKIQVVVSIDPTTKKVDVVSYQKIPL